MQLSPIGFDDYTALFAYVFIHAYNLNMSKNKTYKLTVKQQRFIEEYMIDHNATQAAIRAGYSKKTAHRIGAENMQKPAIVTLIDSKLEELALNNGISVEFVIDTYQRVIKLGMADEEFTRSTVTRDGDVFNTQVKELNLPAVNKAVDSLAKYLKMYSDDDEASKNKHEDGVRVTIVLPDNGRK